MVSRYVELMNIRQASEKKARTAAQTTSSTTGLEQVSRAEIKGKLPENL